MIHQQEYKVEIRKATETDVAEVASILNEASDWLEERGIPLWTRDMLTVNAIAPAVGRGEVFLALRNGQGVGTFMLQGDDPDFWPDVPQGESCVLHRLAIRRSAAGSGLPEIVIYWARNKARIEGKKYFRLDCMADRPKLRSMYEALGFQFYSEWPIYGFVVARYQMDLHNPGVSK